MNDAVDRALALLDAFLVEEAGADYATSRTLAADARALSVSYTDSRDINVDAAGCLAYLAHFGPRAIAATGAALARADVSLLSRVIDVGAGSGAASLVVACAAPSSSLHLVDASAASLELAKRLLRFHSDVSTSVGDVMRPQKSFPPGAPSGKSPATTLLSSFVLGELPETAAPDALVDVLRGWSSALQWVLVDAGDHPRARRLQAIRAVVVARGARLVSPCPHHDACPAMTRERDWCHQRTAKRLPPRLAAFAQAVGRDEAQMSLSHLVVRHDMARTADDPRSLVALGTPLKDKGRVRLPVCGAGGVRFVQALKRHKDAHRALLDVDAGQSLWVVEAGRSDDQGVVTLSTEHPPTS
jgi:ribosomal protein RSM22 (predicted rRNA methylase)